mgnify:CR=1 FL=1
MATKGTNTKIKELKGIKPERVTQEDLKNLQKSVSDLNQAYIELGRITSSQHNKMHQIAVSQDEFEVIRKQLKDTYGVDEINIQDGTINYNANGQADS